VERRVFVIASMMDRRLASRRIPPMTSFAMPSNTPPCRHDGDEERNGPKVPLPKNFDTQRRVRLPGWRRALLPPLRAIPRLLSIREVDLSASRWSDQEK
jgi:hypothetical protein